MFKLKNTPRHSWFKRKGYLHFDKSLKCEEAEKYVTNPGNITRHRFSPLIHYVKSSRKIKRDKAAEAIYKKAGKIGIKPKLEIKDKDRNIFYTSHVDGYIYSYYTHEIQKAYEKFLISSQLTDNIIGYRRISKKEVKFCNSHFAQEAFEFVRRSQGCNVLCFDISKFFDQLSVEVLKNKWSQILDRDKLPKDHFTVYKSLKNFCYVEESHLIESFKGKFDKNPREHGLNKESGGSLRNRICDYFELRQLDEKFEKNGRKLINKKTTLGITGIPQGTAISALLSNIFMIDFDLAVKKKIEMSGGFYRRYSDDIFIAIPASVSFEKVDEYIKEQLKKATHGSLKLNDSKAEKRTYKVTSENTFEVVDSNGKKSRIQYLGFHFDGRSVYIRNSSISKDRAKTVQALKKYKKSKTKIDILKVYKERSSRKLTPHDDIKKKGFVYYAQRAAEVHDSQTIKAQVKKMIDLLKEQKNVKETNSCPNI